MEEQNDEGREMIKALQMLCEGSCSVESIQGTPLEELGCTKDTEEGEQKHWQTLVKGIY